MSRFCMRIAREINPLPRKRVRSRALDSSEQPQSQDDIDEEPACRICHFSTQKEDFIELGCACKSHLGRTHKKCARRWFQSKGNRLCEICQQIAENVEPIQPVVGNNQDTTLLDLIFQVCPEDHCIMLTSYGVNPAARGDVIYSLQHFRHWLEVNGVQLRGCTLKPCEENSQAGIGVYTTDAYPENGILMVTPLALAITPMTALQDPLVGPVFAKLFEDGDVDDRYLKMLPRKFGMTLCYTDKELLDLKGTSLYRATKFQQTGLRQHFYEKVQGLSEAILGSIGCVERKVEFEDFLWANCIFWTRALNIPFPQSLVTPQISPTSALSPGEAEPVEVVGTPVEESGEKTGNLHMFDKQQSISSQLFPCRPQPCEGNLRQDDKLEERGFQGTFTIEDQGKPRSLNNISNMGIADQTLTELGTNGKPEPEATVWVEGLVPGIDFCNHASQAVAVWEVDDERGSASGVRHCMYLVTGSGVEFPSNTEVLINYGNRGNEELLYLYGFVEENNPDDYLMVHFPKEALEHGVCGEEKSLLLEEQKLPLRWLLPLSLLKDVYVNRENSKASPNSDTSKEKQSSHSFSWSGHRKPPHNLERQVFPEELMAALRIIAMTEEEVRGSTALLAELLEPGSERVLTAEDIRAAVWEVCGDAGALQLLQDLLTSKMLEGEEGTGSEDIDADLLEKDAKAQAEALKKRQLGGAYVGDEEFIEKNLMSMNKRACVVYRKGQKHLVKLFLQEAEYALQLWIQ